MISRRACRLLRILCADYGVGSGRTVVTLDPILCAGSAVNGCTPFRYLCFTLAYQNNF